MYSFPYLEPVCSMSSSNCCFLTCIQNPQEAGQAVWYSHLFKNFPQFVVIHTDLCIFTRFPRRFWYWPKLKNHNLWTCFSYSQSVSSKSAHIKELFSPACHCRRRGFDRSSGKIPYSVGQLRACTTATEPMCWSCWSLHTLEPGKQRSHRNEKPLHSSAE